MRTAKYLLFAGLVLVVLLVLKSDPMKIVEAVRHADPLFLAAGMLFTILSQLVRATKLRTLLNSLADNSISFRAFLPVYLLNSMLSNFTPAKSGDFFGGIFFRKFFKTSLGGSVSFILLDRIVELLVICLGILASACYFFIQLQESMAIVKALLAVAVFFVIVAIFLIFTALSSGSTGTVLRYFENRWGSGSAGARISALKTELELFHRGFKELRSPRLYGYLLSMTCAAWFCDICTLYLYLNSVLHLDFIYTMMSFWVSVSIGIITFIPLGLGGNEISLYCLLKQQGQPESLAVAGILIARFIALFIMVLAGVCSYLILNRRIAANDSSKIEEEPH